MKDKAIALYRLPHQSSAFAIKGSLLDYDPSLSKGHFIIAPFNFPEQKGWMIKPETVRDINDQSELSEMELQYVSQKPSHDTYRDIVAKAIEEIGTTSLSKVVLSRIIEIDLNVEDIYQLFFKLSDTYQDAFVYLIHDQQIGTWIGASPESLLIYEQDLFSTQALAGTMKTEDHLSGEEWGNKELEEQAFVKEYILDILNEMHVSHMTVGDIFTKLNGPVCHLCNHIEFKSDQSISNILSALHPTPATCGIPLNLARSFILHNEIHDRSLYTGFIGIDHINNCTQFFVNLRCMRMFSNKANIFVGAGITAKSAPLLEMKETENKAEVLLSVLKNI